jgi:nitric oxide reductase large subunit
LKQDQAMSSEPSPTASSQIVWTSVITVISAAILIGAEVFGAAFAGGWALAILFGLDDTGAHILQAVLFAIGVFIMAAFIRAAQRVEPFTRRA